MTGEREKTSRCPLCGGRLKRGLAAMPFLLRDAVVLIKDVPAEICANCHEPFTSGKATDGVIDLLTRYTICGPRSWCCLMRNYSRFRPPLQ